jgi:hypothetical protein
MRKDAAVLAGIAAFAVILAIVFWNRQQQDRARAAELQQQVEQLQKGGAAPMASMPDVLVKPAVAPASPGAPATQATTTAAPPAPSGIKVATDCEAVKERLRSNAAAAEADVIAELKLTPAEAQRLIELREAQSFATYSCGDAPLPHANLDQLQAQLEATLGPARYEQMMEAKTRRTTRDNMSVLGFQVAALGVPLTDEQSSKLSATILEESRRSRRDARYAGPPEDPRARLAYEEEVLKLTEERYDRTLKAAQAYLKPEQLQQLTTNTSDELARMRTRLLRIRTSVEAGKGIPQSMTFINAPLPQPLPQR